MAQKQITTESPSGSFMPIGDDPAVRLASSFRLEKTGIVELSDFGHQFLKSCILLQTSEAYVLFYTLRRFLRQSVADSLSQQGNCNIVFSLKRCVAG